MADMRLLDRVAEDLRIHQGLQEDRLHYEARLLYSCIGQMALASLYDQMDEDLETISKVRFTGRIRDLWAAFLEIYPDLKEVFFLSGSFLAETLYSLYAATGFLYHESWHIRPARERSCDLGPIRLIRGSNLDGSAFFSGLGLYFPFGRIERLEQDGAFMDRKRHVRGAPGQRENLGDFYDFFQIDHADLHAFYRRLESRALWQKVSVPENAEFLRTDAKVLEGYWGRKPDARISFSLMRSGEGSRVYALYRFQGKSFEMSTLPPFQAENRAYFQAANAILDHEGSLPAITYRTDGRRTLLRIGYLFPPPLQNLLELYSWPGDMHLFETTYPMMTCREMETEVFQALLPALSLLGYRFEERELE